MDARLSSVRVRKRGSRRCTRATRGCVEFVCAVCLLEISVRYFSCFSCFYCLLGTVQGSVAIEGRFAKQGDDRMNACVHVMEKMSPEDSEVRGLNLLDFMRTVILSSGSSTFARFLSHFVRCVCVCHCSKLPSRRVKHSAVLL